MNVPIDCDIGQLPFRLWDTRFQFQCPPVSVCWCTRLLSAAGECRSRIRLWPRSSSPMLYPYHPHGPGPGQERSQVARPSCCYERKWHCKRGMGTWYLHQSSLPRPASQLCTRIYAYVPFPHSVAPFGFTVSVRSIEWHFILTFDITGRRLNVKASICFAQSSIPARPRPVKVSLHFVK